MENNCIRDIIVDHFIMEKEQSAISPFTEVMKLFSHSKAYLRYDHKTFTVAKANKLDQSDCID